MQAWHRMSNKTKGKALIVSNPYLPQLSGVPIVSQVMAMALVEAGWDVTVITEMSLTGTEEEHESRQNLRVVRTKSSTTLAIECRRADVVIMNGGCSRKVGLSCQLSRAKLIAWHQMAGTETSVGKLSKLLYSVASGRVNLHVGASETALKTRNPNGGGIVVYNPGRDCITKFAKERSETFTDRGIDFLYVGRIDRSKGVELFLDSLEQLQKDGMSFRAEIIGGGPLQNIVESRCKEFQNRSVRYLGQLNGETLANKYASSKYLVVPTTSGHREGFPLVVAESLAFGTPIISANSPELVEAVANCGELFEMNSKEGLVELLRRSLEPYCWEKYSVRCQPRFKLSFAEQVFKKSIVDIVSSCVFSRNNATI